MLWAVSTEVSSQSLKSSFNRFDRASGVSPGDVPRRLLRFYAAECGLKAAIMKQRKLDSTNRLEDRLRTHDLVRLAKELRLSPGACAGIKPCRRPRVRDADRTTVPVEAVHEAWRYGARLDTADEKGFVAGLDSIVEWCGKVLR